MGIKSEDRIQQECVMWFHNKYPKLRGLLFAVPNGGARSATEGHLFKMTGVVAGVSDLILLYDTHAYLFELKNELGSQSAKQIAWQEKVEMQNFRYFIIRDVDLFMQIVDGIIKHGGVTVAIQDFPLCLECQEVTCECEN